MSDNTGAEEPEDCKRDKDAAGAVGADDDVATLEVDDEAAATRCRTLSLTISSSVRTGTGRVGTRMAAGMAAGSEGGNMNPDDSAPMCCMSAPCPSLLGMTNR